MNTCPRCKSTSLTSRTIRYSQEYGGKVYIVEDVPAYVCEQCGEVLLTESIAAKIQNLIWSGATPERTEEVPVYKVVA